VRLALDATTEAGRRAGLILLNGTGLDLLGLVDSDPSGDADVRVERAYDLSSYDGVITDRDDPSALHDRAERAGTPLVCWVDYEPERAHTTVVVGSNLATGLTTCLAFHEAARSSEVMGEALAWTEPGRPLRRGTKVAFPDPVGPRWGSLLPGRDDQIPTTRVVVPIEGDWAAASAQVTCATTDGVVRRVVGVADLAVHLEGIALAAGAATIDHFPSGLSRPLAAAEMYLSKALEMGLAVATYVEGTTGRR